MKYPKIGTVRPQPFGKQDSLDHLRVELLVPRAVERGGDVEPLSVQAELQHLGGAAELPALHAGKVGTVLEKKPLFISHPEKKNNS